MLRAARARAGLELEASELQVQRSNRSATLPPRILLDMTYVAQFFFQVSEDSI